MMPNTLGLDDDLDGVEVVLSLERIFDIKVSIEEAARVITVGDFYDLLLRKIIPNEADRKCATAMTFYRLRDALKQLGYGAKLTPASSVLFLERGRTKSNLKRLEKQSGLQMPEAAPTRSSSLPALACLLATTAGVFSLQPGILSALAGLLIGLLVALVAVVVVSNIDPGKLPCVTLAELTKMTAPLNYGRLVKMGARHRKEDIWEHLVEALSRYGLPKSEITHETYFLRSQLKKITAA
jgi:hypothetical protein